MSNNWRNKRTQESALSHSKWPFDLSYGRNYTIILQKINYYLVFFLKLVDINISMKLQNHTFQQCIVCDDLYSNTYKYDKDQIIFNICRNLQVNISIFIIFISIAINFVIHTLTNIIYHFFVAGIKLYVFITNLFPYSDMYI